MPLQRMSREQVRATLGRFGLRRAFDDLPHEEQERLRYRTSRWFRLTETAEFTKATLAAEVRRLAATALRSWTFDLGPPVGRVSVDEFFGLVAAVSEYAEGHPAFTTDPLFAEAVRRVDAHRSTAAAELLTALQVAFDRYSRPDMRIYWARLGGRDRNTFTFELDAQPAPKRTAVIDGKPRTVYRCLDEFGSDSIEWLSWDPAAVPGRQPGPPIEVYAQGHALHSVDKRAHVSLCPGFAEHWLLNSLRRPMFVQLSDRLVVRYQVRGVPVGHMHVEFVDGMAVVTTLILCTMWGCPTGDALQAEARRVGRTIEDLGLNCLETIVSGRAFVDPVARDLLVRSGLGHLEGLASLAQDFAAALGDISVLR